MDKILLHICGIAILEIIFYFTYIGPMETQLFKETFKNSLNSLYKDNTQSNTHYLNTTILLDYYDQNSDLDQQLKSNADKYEKERIKYNNNLFYEMSIYWVILFSITVVIYFITYYFKNKYVKENNKEMQQIAIHDIEDNVNEENVNLILKEENSKTNYCYKLLYYITFGGLILLFEYIFFQYIVTQYHVISQGEIKYIIFSQSMRSAAEEIKKHL